MKNLITSSNLTFTKKKCNCGITSNTAYKTKSKKKYLQRKNKSKKNIK